MAVTVAPAGTFLTSSEVSLVCFLVEFLKVNASGDDGSAGADVGRRGSGADALPLAAAGAAHDGEGALDRARLDVADGVGGPDLEGVDAGREAGGGVGARRGAGREGPGVRAAG